MYFCQVCQKSCSGIENFRQHEASEKHKKKVKLFEQSNGHAGGNALQNSVFNYSSKIQSSFICDLCTKSFTSLSDYQQHTVSEEHALTVLNKNSRGKLPEEKSPSSHASTDSLCEAKTQSSACEIDAGHSASIKSPMPYYSRCEPCDKNFSGPEPYEAHIVSLKHKKKCGLNSSQSLAEAGTNQIPLSPASSDQKSPVMHLSMDVKVNSVSKFRCDHCNMMFNGPAPYQQHLDSPMHDKKVKRNLLADQPNLKRAIDVADTGAGLSNKRPVILPAYYCEVCNITCSGPDNLRQHNVSKRHVKAVATAEIGARRMETLMNVTDKLRDSQCDAKIRATLLSSTPKSNDSQGVCSEEKGSSLAEASSTNDTHKISASGEDMGVFLRQTLFNEDLKAVDPSSLNLTVFKVEDPIDFDTKVNKVDDGELAKIISEEYEIEKDDDALELLAVD